MAVFQLTHSVPQASYVGKYILTGLTIKHTKLQYKETSKGYKGNAKTILIFPSNTGQTRMMVLAYISKHLEIRPKYPATLSIFNSLHGV